MSRIFMAYGGVTDENPVTLLPKDRNKCACVSDMIVIQCIIVCIGAVSILACFWTPEHSTHDYAKLTRIMYLYDSQACGYKVKKAKAIANLQFNNDTFGLDVRPIKWLPVITTVSTRLSAKTRNYMKFTFGFHVAWFILSVFFRAIIKNSTDVRVLKFALIVYFYSFIFMVCFDLSMAVVYVTHIKQSLSKGMILRYSGWSTELTLDNHEDFAGWLPIAASACWLRGVVIFMLNLYFCRVLLFVRRKMLRRAMFQKELYNELYQPFPEAEQVQTGQNDILVYRVGEDEPQMGVYDYFKGRQIYIRN